jgi:hypothetical protein
MGVRYYDDPEHGEQLRARHPGHAIAIHVISTDEVHAANTGQGRTTETAPRYSSPPTAGLGAVVGCAV